MNSIELRDCGNAKLSYQLADILNILVRMYIKKLIIHKNLFRK